MTYIEFLTNLTMQDDTKIIAYIVTATGVTLIDFIMGVAIAMFNKNIKFSSSELKMGLLVKTGIIVLNFILVPIFVIWHIPLEFLYVIVTGFMVADLRSIIGHLTGSDGKQNDGLAFLTKLIDKYWDKKGDIDE